MSRGDAGRPRPSPAISAPDEQMRQRVSAYPGTLTFNDLIHKNKRQSAVLMVVMIILGVVLGGVLSGAIAVWQGVDQDALIPSAVLGAMVAFVLACLGATWSWFGGSSAILAMSGAHQIQKADDPQLFNVVEEIAIAAGLPMPRVYLINDSAMNAFATGRDPQHASVAITKGLRDQLTRDELQGVLAHEMAHVRHLDVRFAMLMATMVGLIVFACDAFLRIAWYSGGIGGRGRRSRGRDEGGGAGGLIAIILLVLGIVLAMLAPLFATLIQMAYSRQREYLADAGAVELTRNPLGLASALQKLADDREPLVDTANRGTAHMYIVNPLRRMRATGQGLDTMFLSHPPIKERIARLMALAR